MPGAKAFSCDVGDDAQIAALIQHVGKETAKLDFLVHSIAFAPREELTGQFVNTTRQGFATALDVSAYSLVALTRAALPLMTDGGSVVTLTYLGRNGSCPTTMLWGSPKPRSKPPSAIDRKSTRLNSSHERLSRMPSSA